MALAILLLAATAGVMQAQDFYETRLHAGEAELSAGQPLTAMADLRIAAFGFLDRPPLLCRALAALAVAQERAGRREEQQATLARFVEVERRFAAYQKAEIPAGVASEFASVLRQRVPAATLNSLPALAGVSPTVTPEKRAARGGPARPPESERRASLTPAPPAPTERLEQADRPAPDSERLDQPPQIRSTVRPVYPPDAFRAGVGGTVLLRVLVSDAGVPLQVEVVRGIRADLADAAIAAVRQWRFEPARRGNRNVAAWTSVSVPFQR